jgi:cell division protein FtsI (penicillin-binding protein 3)
VIFIIAACFGILAYRIFDLSFFSRPRYLSSIKRTRNIVRESHAKRGNILDCHGEILATSAVKIVIGVDPYAADIETDRNKILILADALNMLPGEVFGKFARNKVISKGKISKLRWVPICSVDEVELLHAIERLKIKGVYGIHNYVRMYPFGSVCAHVPGFVNHNEEALCGVEQHADFCLRGQDGFVVSERDGLNQELVQDRTQNIPAKDGFPVVLTIDAKIQQMLADELKNLVEIFHPECASVIISDAVTGELLTIGKYPIYDSNDSGKYSFNDMRNRAASDTSEPGSLSKIVSSRLAFEHG